MIDVTKVLKRAWNILWSYRALWVIGMVLALTTASATSRGSSSAWREDTSGWQPGENLPLPTRDEIRQAWEEMRLEINQEFSWGRITPDEWNTFLWIMIGLAALLIVVGVAMMVARYTSEVAVIRMVDEYERTDQKISLRQGLRYGWSRTAWRLFLINLLVMLPVVLLILGGLVLGGIILYIVFADGSLLGTMGIVAMIGLVFVLLFLGIIVGVVMMLLRELFWRACVLENVGVRQSIRLGWDMLRQNWKSVGLVWLVMIAVRIAWAIAMLLAFFITIPVLILTILVGLVVGGLPALLVGGVTSLFLGGPLPWIVGVIFGLPLFLVVAFSPLVFFRGLELVYNSTVWTLTYRELGLLQDLPGSESLDQEEPGDEIPSPI